MPPRPKPTPCTRLWEAGLASANRISALPGAPWREAAGGGRRRNGSSLRAPCCPGPQQYCFCTPVMPAGPVAAAEFTLKFLQHLQNPPQTPQHSWHSYSELRDLLRGSGVNAGGPSTKFLCFMNSNLFLCSRSRRGAAVSRSCYIHETLVISF